MGQTTIAITMVLAAGLSFLAASCVPLQGPSSAKPGGPATSHAEAYYQWLSGCLDGIEKDLPVITASAEQAAAAYLQDGWEIGVFGDRGMVGEFNSRAGGLMRTHRPEALEKADWKGIVLLFPRETSLAKDLAKAQEFLKQGKLVIGFGGPAVRQAARSAGLEWTAFVDTHAAASGGLFPVAGGAWVVPTDPPANIAAMWTWTAEFVGALTRRGKMPPIYQSIMVPTAQERNKPYANLKFHEAVPQKVAAGELGRDYLTHLRKALATLREQDMGSIVKVAEQAVAARQAGCQSHVFAHGHAIRYDLGIPHDPGYLHQVNRGLFELKDKPGIAKGDFIFCVGYDRIFQGWYFENATDRMRAAGATFAWSMTDYNQDPKIGPAAVPAGEIIVWQHWALGDAVATVPGYDIKILPPSGVIGEAVLWMTEAQMLAILGPDSVAVPTSQPGPATPTQPK